MAEIEIKLTGFDELQRKLEELPPRAAKQALRTGLLAGGEIWRREMEATVRQGWHHFRKHKGASEYGVLARNIGTSARITSDLAGSIAIGPRKKGFWALFLEFGTRKMPAFPFIRRAFETRKQDVLEEFAIETKAAVERAGMKLD